MSKDRPEYWAGHNTASGVLKNWMLRDKAGRTYTCYVHPINTENYEIILNEGAAQNLRLVLTAGDLRLLRDLLVYMGEELA